ncbi:MAG: hypothetical protein MJ252_27375 [archaeon]|nr:hypothetical protein [archaeon]
MPKPSKYSELFSSDIFNQRDFTPTPHPRIETVRNSTNNTQLDIFPFASNLPSQVLSQNRSRDHLHSDIFFREEAKNNRIPSPNRGRITESTVFSDCKSTDYKVKREKVISNYKPENYVNFNVPNAIRHAKNFYTQNENKEPFQPNCKDGRIRGYYTQTEQEKNKTDIEDIKLDPKKKRCLWNYENSTDTKFITKTEEEKNIPKSKKLNKSSIDETKAKMNRINILQSNIFNDPNKKKYNFNSLKVKEKQIKTKPQEQRKPIHTKWPKSKFYWLDAPTELIFKKFDDSKEKDITPFNRKQKELSSTISVFDYSETEENKNLNKSSDVYFNPCITENKKNTKSNKDLISLRRNAQEKKNLKIDVYDNIEDINRLKKIITKASPKMKVDKVMKCIDQSSSVGFDRNFYERNLGHQKLNTIQGNTNEFEIKNINNTSNTLIDDIAIKRLLTENGIHAYNINIENDGMGKDVKYNFSVRDNSPNKEDFEKKMNKACIKIQKEKGISIQPIKKLSPNKRKVILEKKENPVNKKRIIKRREISHNENKSADILIRNKNNFKTTPLKEKIKERNLSNSAKKKTEIKNKNNIYPKKVTKTTNQKEKKTIKNAVRFMKNRFSNQFARVDKNYKNNLGFIPMNRLKTSLGKFI